MSSTAEGNMATRQQKIKAADNQGNRKSRQQMIKAADNQGIK
jgi:hypothetical protein